MRVCGHSYHLFATLTVNYTLRTKGPGAAPRLLIQSRLLPPGGGGGAAGGTVSVLSAGTCSTFWVCRGWGLCLNPGCLLGGERFGRT